MKKILVLVAALGIVGGGSLPAQADPASDLNQFRAFYKKRFPTIKFDEYSNGLYALPAAANQRAKWELSMESSPYELALAKGKKFWEQNKMAGCFRNGGKNIAQNYPYWNRKKKMVWTLELAINDCLKRKGKKPLKEEKLAAVTAYLKSMSRGQRVKLDLSAPGMRRAYEEGKKFYWAKRGQLNLACADCHVQGAGKSMGGNILSAGLGHGVGFPAYRSKWGALGTIHRRYRSCNKQVGAAPLKQNSKAYRHLELYETYMATGLPLTAPSQRF